MNTILNENDKRRYLMKKETLMEKGTPKESFLLFYGNDIFFED